MQPTCFFTCMSSMTPGPKVDDVDDRAMRSDSAWHLVKTSSRWIVLKELMQAFHQRLSYCVTNVKSKHCIMPCMLIGVSVSNFTIDVIFLTSHKAFGTAPEEVDAGKDKDRRCFGKVRTHVLFRILTLN